jgi:DNA-3-methyladenine glycosylase II
VDDSAVGYLRGADPVMAEVIDTVGTEWLDGPRRPADLPTKDHFAFLVRAIAGQQVSTAAASAIYARLSARYDGAVPTPERLLADDPEAMRVAAGLSHAKLRYLRALAADVVAGELDLTELDALADDEVARRLTAVTGIGPWVASLFLMFELDRPDVVAAGDLGIRQAIRRAYALPAVPTIADTEELGDAWRPYRTLACQFLWRYNRTAPV